MNSYTTNSGKSLIPRVLEKQYLECLASLQDHVEYLTKSMENPPPMEAEYSKSYVTNEQRFLNSINASEDYSNLQPILSINQLMLHSFNEKEEIIDGKEIDLTDFQDHEHESQERTRVERSIDVDDDPSDINPPDQSLLKRTKRGGRPRKGRKSERSKRHISFTYGRGNIIKNKAVAFHARVQDNGGPYAGNSLNDHFINSWETSPAIRYGFDFTRINNGPTGGVKVRIPGVYYIYSQVAFKMGAGIEANHKITTGLLGNLNLSACTGSFPSDHSSDDYITCHASGIVKLGKNQLIRLHITPRNLQVFMSPQHTYFGAFLLGK